MKFPQFSLKDDTGQVLPSFLLENLHYIACFVPDMSDGSADLADRFDGIYQKLMIRNIVTLMISPSTQEELRERVLERDIKIKLLSDPDGRLASECSVSGITTFIVGKDGEVLARWDDVDPEGHVQVVYDRLKSFFKSA